MKSRFLLLMVTLLAAATSFANINLQKYSMYLTAGTATAGKTIDVTLSMKNANAITSWQTKLALPEGFTLAAATASGTRYGETLPTVTTQANEDGTITLFCEVDEPMTGTDGVVATLTLAVAANVAAGEYKLALNGATMVDLNEKAWARTETVETAITVEEATGIQGDVNGDGIVSSADIQGVLNAIAASSNDPVADVNGDGIVSSADIQAVLNIIAGN